MSHEAQFPLSIEVFSCWERSTCFENILLHSFCIRIVLVFFQAQAGVFLFFLCSCIE